MCTQNPHSFGGRYARSCVAWRPRFVSVHPRVISQYYHCQYHCLARQLYDEAAALTRLILPGQAYLPRLAEMRLALIAAGLGTCILWATASVRRLTHNDQQSSSMNNIFTEAFACSSPWQLIEQDATKSEATDYLIAYSQAYNSACNPLLLRGFASASLETSTKAWLAAADNNDRCAPVTIIEGC